jgi:quercetin dioxygenase-like cupin family protein
MTYDQHWMVASRMKTGILIVCFMLALSAIIVAQLRSNHIDPTEVSPEKYTILLENEHVRVLEYEIQPGEKDAWHTHPPKVSYVVSGGSLRITPKGGESFVVEEKSGSAAWMGAVGPHVGENVGATPVRIALVELKLLADTPFEDLGGRD